VVYIPVMSNNGIRTKIKAHLTNVVKTTKASILNGFETALEKNFSSSTRVGWSKPVP